MNVRLFGILFCAIFLTACSGTTEKQIVKTPILKLKASGPFFQGPNTATAQWSFALDDLFTNQDGDEITIEDAHISNIEIMPVNGESYPEIGKVVMEMKSKNTSMKRIGLLDTNLDTTKKNNLSVAEIQEDFEEAFADNEIIFVADFDILDQEYYDDINFELLLTFQIETSK
ncbi:hypothetical protein [Psychroflexus sp. ALD_RP9]|uniref:hypothetical protein n=1 Tax=Psychroflexus sp. ALD_RP9 TaxID=2777186 RepID=UPI001A8E8079|nr:hypothetical protein [Psychroflexus sp. ALD_RP9]QSS98128.1 hypothetical protein IMZ30_05280 [Psychroflexus sp. ALD_RP9]